MTTFRFRIGPSLFHFRIFAILGACTLISTFLLLYLLLDYTFFTSSSQEQLLYHNGQKGGLTQLEKQLDILEAELNKNQMILDQVKESVLDLTLVSPKLNHYSINRTSIPIPQEGCHFGKLQPQYADIQMLNLYDRLKFDNPNGGVWKQGWDIKYEANSWHSENKLKIFVVPHSHNDPGWLKTFSTYYKDQTRFILDNMLIKLPQDRRRKFIWAEISYFSVWFEQLNSNQKLAVKKLVADGQLEFVTGGWVMADEAVTHYFALIEQMIEGHLWLKKNFGFQPKNGWAIDPFGLSPTMAYLLRRSGLENMVIQRAHYSVKKYLAQHKSLEFFWRQTWDQNGTTSIVCHLMPFYSYDIPHTCGPDPKVCCQFDFKRLPGGKVKCPWRIPPQAINNANVKDKAYQLLDQYRKKAQLFRSNVVLVPLGDDFRFDKLIEWDQQYNNYQKLFDYMNSDPSMNVEAQFGTLNDYFTALQEDLHNTATTDQLLAQLPMLTGDFFTYADRDDHYWSGFYTSRPFYKHMERWLETNMRTADILFSLSLAHKNGPPNPQLIELLSSYLLEGRRTLSLFQHHDAITGTSKDHVVVDYANSILRSFQNLKKVICHSTVALLLDKADETVNASLPVLEMEEIYLSIDALPEKVVLHLNPKLKRRTLVLFNSLGQPRHELITVHVSSIFVVILSGSGQAVPAQLGPVFEKDVLKEGIYELTFRVEVPGLSLSTYTLQEGTTTPKASVRLFNYPQDQTLGHKLFSSSFETAPDEFSLKNNYLTASFSGSDGMLRRVKSHEEGITTDLRINFLKYGTRVKGKDKSGAYLFLPNEEAQGIEYANPLIRVIEGPLLSEVVVILPHVENHIKLKNSPGADGLGLEITNIANILQEVNKELVMRIYSSVYSSSYFTDLNGFQMAKRKQLAKLPLQGNIYPISTLMYIEDNSTRISLITKQPLGGSSLKPGWLEVFLDRRLKQDDNRGLQQGVIDNKVTSSQFVLLLEYATTNGKEVIQSHPSLSTHHARLSLLHPMIVLPSLPGVEGKLAPHHLQTSFTPLGTTLPCDMHLLNLRTLSLDTLDKSALFFHRFGHDCTYKTHGLNCTTHSGGKVSISSLFPNHFGSKVEEISLSLLYHGAKFPKDTLISLPPMEVGAYLLGHS